MSCDESRVRELEALTERLRAEVVNLNAEWDGAESAWDQCHAKRCALAEDNERLRAKVTVCQQAAFKLAVAKNAAEARLATAVGLLERIIEVFLASTQPAAPTRTEAEQAVLLAMRGASEPSLRGYAESTKADWLGCACRAELARRGLK